MARLARVAWLARLVGWADGPRLVGLLSWLGYTAEGKFGGLDGARGSPNGTAASAEVS